MAWVPGSTITKMRTGLQHGTRSTDFFIDKGVEFIDVLDWLGIAEDTILILAADHGHSTGEHGFWGHGAATMPANKHRAAHSIPMIVHQPGVDAMGLCSRLLVSDFDLFATILDHVGVEQNDNSVPSRSLMPVLTGGDLSDWGEYWVPVYSYDVHSNQRN